jgi:glycosyltransferase involved in cell wall biosynthesis
MVYYYGGQSSVNYEKGFGQTLTWDIPLLNGYDHVFLNNASASKGMNTRFFDAVNWSIFKLLRQSNDKLIIVNGWAYMSDWFVILAAKLYGKKVWMRAEMPWNQEELKPKSFKKFIKYLIFKHLIFKYFIDKCLYIGSQNKKYYLMHGVKESSLIFAPYAVDNQRFQSFKTDRSSARQKWNIDDKQIIILYSGKLIDKKRPLDLLRSFHKLDVANTVLFYLGDGPLRNDLEAYIAQHQVKNVFISGFINQTEIGKIYSMADLFVMCSGIGETWGLSVNEAMNFSLPVIVSSTCGSSFDLVENGVNGYVFKEGDIDALTQCIQVVVKDAPLREKMGVASSDKINQFSYKVTIENIKALLNPQ